MVKLAYGSVHKFVHPGSEDVFLLLFELLHAPVFSHRHDSPLFDFIESCLRNKHEMVVYEAASAIVHMPNCTARELAPAVSGQCLFLLSSVSFCARVCECVSERVTD